MRRKGGERKGGWLRFEAERRVGVGMVGERTVLVREVEETTTTSILRTATMTDQTANPAEEVLKGGLTANVHPTEVETAAEEATSTARVRKEEDLGEEETPEVAEGEDRGTEEVEGAALGEEAVVEEDLVDEVVAVEEVSEVAEGVVREAVVVSEEVREEDLEADKEEEALEEAQEVEAEAESLEEVGSERDTNN